MGNHLHVRQRIGSTSLGGEPAECLLRSKRLLLKLSGCGKESMILITRDLFLDPISCLLSGSGTAWSSNTSMRKACSRRDPRGGAFCGSSKGLSCPLDRKSS